MSDAKACGAPSPEGSPSLPAGSRGINAGGHPAGKSRGLSPGRRGSASVCAASRRHPGRGDLSERNCTTAQRSNPGKSILESKGLPTSSVTTRRPATSQVTASLAGAGGEGGHEGFAPPLGREETLSHVPALGLDRRAPGGIRVLVSKHRGAIRTPTGHIPGAAER